MSYDISLHIDGEIVGDIGNYTSNVAGMWREALGHSLSDLHGRTAGDVVDQLGDAVTAMETDPDRYRAMQRHQWGTYDGALEYLRSLWASCLVFPQATINISA